MNATAGRSSCWRGLETHSQAYSAFQQSSTVPPSLADDIHRLEAAQRVDREDKDQDETEESDGHRIDYWMLICQHNAEFGQATGEEEDCDRSLAARAYPELRKHFGRWNKYDPCILDSMITDGNLCNMGIYVNHPTNHFEVVTSISLV